MYLTFDEYRQAGGHLDEGGFAAADPIAELYLDSLTMSRLKRESYRNRLRDRGDWYAVTLALTWLIDGMEAVSKTYSEQLSGKDVSSFSNGRTTIAFKDSGGSENSSLASLCDRVYAVLPIDLASAWAGGCDVC